MRIGTLESKIDTSSPAKEKSPSNKSKRMSAQEIRSKVAANNSRSPEKVKLGPKMGLSRYEESEKGKVADVPRDKVNLERPSDIGLNDPSDPATHGKLKDLLSKGAVNFNDRERGVLDKILSQD